MSLKTDELAFLNACIEGNVRVVKAYLAQQGFDMNVGDNNGNTGFHLACQNGNINVVQLLVQRGFNMNVVGGATKRTGFQLACICGKLNVVQFILKQGFDWNVRDYFGSTGFHDACQCGKLNVVQFFVQQGFEGINEVNVNGMTGLQTLIDKQNIFHDNVQFIICLLLLIEAGAELDENDVFEELISAIQYRIIEITFMKKTIFQKWTGRIAQEITDFVMDPIRNTSLQNLSQFLD